MGYCRLGAAAVLAADRPKLVSATRMHRGVAHHTNEPDTAYMLVFTQL
jgi:hypothetical protein